MRPIHLSRIDGLALLMLVLGFVGGILIGWKMLIVIVPVTLIWLMSYDEKSYEYKETKKSS